MQHMQVQEKRKRLVESTIYRFLTFKVSEVSGLTFGVIHIVRVWTPVLILFFDDWSVFLSCDYTFSQGKCMLSHSSFSWAMFEDMFGPKKWLMIKLPPVKWHCIVLSHISIKDRSHESNRSHHKFLWWKLQKQFFTKKSEENDFWEEWVGFAF